MRLEAVFNQLIRRCVTDRDKDTFTGYLIAELDRGQPIAQAIRTAQRAGALMVARVGTADVIPDLREVQDAATLGT